MRTEPLLAVFAYIFFLTFFIMEFDLFSSGLVEETGTLYAQTAVFA